MKKLILVVLAIVLMAGVAQAEQSDVERTMYNGQRPKVLTAVNFTAMMNRGCLSALDERNGVTYSAQSAPGEQTNVWQAGDFSRIHHVRNGVLIIGECGNRVLKVYAERYLDEAVPGLNGANGSNGSNGEEGPPGPAGPAGPAGPQGICWEAPAAASALSPKPQYQQPAPRRAPCALQALWSVEFESAPEERVEVRQAQTEGAFGQILGAVAGVAGAYLGRAPASNTTLIATGGAGGAGGSSVSQAGSTAYSNATNRNNIRLNNTQAQTQRARSQSNPVQNQALNAPIAVAVDAK